MDLTELCAENLMQKEVKTVGENTTLEAAARMMRDDGVSSLVVERKNEKDALGIVTRKDIVDALVLDAIDGLQQIVEEVMTKPAITVTPGTSIYHCFQTMKMIGVRRIPVVQGDELVGILSNTDVFDYLVKNLS